MLKVDKTKTVKIWLVLRRPLGLALALVAIGAPAMNWIERGVSLFALPQIELRLSQTECRSCSGIRAHGSLVHGAVMLRLAIQIADRCLEARTSYSANTAC